MGPVCLHQCIIIGLLRWPWGVAYEDGRAHGYKQGWADGKPTARAPDRAIVIVIIVKIMFYNFYGVVCDMFGVLHVHQTGMYYY